MSCFRSIKSLLKSVGQFYSALFGVDKFMKSDSGEELKNTVNSAAGRDLFQTKKTKSKQEEKFRQETYQAQQDAVNLQKTILETLEKINRKL